MKRFILLLFCVLSLLPILAQSTVHQFALKDVKLLPSRFQRNMHRDSAWIASIPVNSLLHSFRNTAGVFSSKEGGYMTMKHLGGWESLDCDLRGHTTGHLLSAMAYLQMKEKADSLVQGLAEVQRQYGTGYLSAYGEGLIDRNI
ncbi:MAG: glycoside hydrolase family 127 protein, partial [Paraprevotella sp.]|nr:glycoside hydrolase family 127 protein [Paraprevotella sp.]